MPVQRIIMRKIKDILRLKMDAGLSHEQIACALKISKGVVSKYVNLAHTSGLDWPTAQSLDETDLRRRLLPTVVQPHQCVMPHFSTIHQELKRKGITLMLLWEEYRIEHASEHTYCYSKFCLGYRRFAKQLKRSMRQVHRAGEKLFIDFAGPTVSLTQGGVAHIFVSAMGASSYTYACATPSEKTIDWIHGTIRALEFYGGVTQLIVPDNPRALISNPDRYEPESNQTVLDFAAHYNTSILPARTYSPQDKAKVESAVQVVERWILARLRHYTFATVTDVDQAIGSLLEQLNNKPFQKLPGSRASTFHELDAPALLPLPQTRYEIAQFKTVKVHIDSHIEVDGHYYSVPHQLVGRTLEARITAQGIEILHRGIRVVSHARSMQRGHVTTLTEHLPSAHQAHREWTPERLIHWGESIGPATKEVVTRLIAQYKHPEHGYRSTLGLLSLAKKYGRPRLEAGCTVALQIGTHKYRHVRDILINNRDQCSAPSESDWVSPHHDQVRGPGYYQ